MFEIAPDHAIGIYAGLLALPIALIALRLMPGRHAVPGTAQAAAVLMAMSGAIHLGLVSTHLEEPVTAALFVMNRSHTSPCHWRSLALVAVPQRLC